MTMEDPGDSKTCPFCAETIRKAAVKCRFCGSDLAGPAAGPAPGTCPPEEKDRIRRHLRALNGLSFLFGIPGLALQVWAVTLGPTPGQAPQDRLDAAVLRLLVSIVGAVLLITGLVFNAKWKGRHGAWGLLGCLSCVGLLILYFLPKKCHHCGAGASHAASRCLVCDAPM